MSTRSFGGVTVAVIAAVLLGIPVPAAAADAGSESEAAVWTPKEASFTYMGFTTKYSCGGLASKVRAVLLSLGARREDLKVFGTGCEVSPGLPAPFPGVKVRMNVLEPATRTGGDTVPARWKAVQVQLDADPIAEAGECELVEQIKQQLLPLFSARDIEFKPDCVPHQVHPGGTRLQARVLMADAPPDRQAATGHAR